MQNCWGLSASFPLPPRGGAAPTHARPWCSHFHVWLHVAGEDPALEDEGELCRQAPTSKLHTLVYSIMWEMSQSDRDTCAVSCALCIAHLASITQP